MRYYFIFILSTISLYNSQTANSPIWSLTSTNSKSYQTTTIPSSITKYGSVEAKTYQNGNDYILSIGTKTCTITSYFKEIQSFYSKEANKYYICPKDEFGRIIFLDTSSGSCVFNKFDIFQNMEDSSRAWKLKCFLRTREMPDIILVAFMDHRYVKGFNTNTNQWVTNTILNQYRKIVENQLSDDANYLFTVLTEKPGNNQLVATKIDLSGDSRNPSASTVRKKNIGVYEQNDILATFSLTASGNEYKIVLRVIAYTKGGESFKLYMFNDIVFDKSGGIEDYKKFEAPTTVSNLPVSISNDFTITDLQIVNNSPYCLYYISIKDSEEKYWGMMDLNEDVVLFNSNEKINSITQVDDPLLESKSFMVTKDDSYMVICPFIFVTDTCTGCTNTMLIDSVEGNYCGTSPTNSEVYGTSYKQCPTQTFFEKTQVACSDCTTNGKVLIEPYGYCEDSATANAKQEYACDTNGCTHCKGNGHYLITYTNGTKSCVADKPTNTYVSNVENNILSFCAADCATCSKGESGGNSNCDSCLGDNYLQGTGGNCDTTCEASSIYGKHTDTSIKKCVVCSTLGVDIVKFENTEDCIDKNTLTSDDYYFEMEGGNGILKRCEDGCNTCDKDDYCKSCIVADHKFKTVGTTKKCVASCGSDEGYDETTMTCVNCKTYIVGTEYYRYDDDEKCQSIPAGHQEGVNYVTADSGNNILIECSEGTLTCVLAQDANGDNYAKSTSCSNTYTLYNDKCVIQCRDNSMGLFQGTCINCQTEGLYKKVDGFICEAFTDQGYYLSDNVNNILSKCNDDCLTCSGGFDASSKNCTSCRTNYLKDDRTDCVTDCSYNTLLMQDNVNKKCVNCATNMNGLTVKWENTNDCIDPTTITDKYYIKDPNYGIIARCDINCNSCKKADVGDDSVCLSCVQDTFMQISSDDCVSTCAANETTTYYPYGKTNGKCEKCPDNTDQRIYKLADSTQCITKPTYKFAVVEQNLGIIEECDSTCEECSGKAEGTKKNCLQCTGNNYLQPGTDGICELTCPYTHGKATINGIKKCVVCSTGFKKKNDDFCLENTSTLPDGYYFVTGFEAYNLIDECYQGCKGCQGSSTSSTNQLCDSCVNGKFLEYKKTYDAITDTFSGAYTDNCVDNCNQYEYKDTSNNKCANCKEKNQYFFDGNCIGTYGTLPIGKYEIDNFYGALANCYPSCGSCSILGDENDHKCDSCREGYEQDQLVSTKCNFKCDVSQFYFYYDDSNLIHCTTSKQCPSSNPYLSEEDKQCLTAAACKGADKYLHNDKCVPQCPPGYKLDNDKFCQLMAIADGDCKYSPKTEISYNKENVQASLESEMAEYVNTLSSNDDNTIVNVISGNDIVLTIFTNNTCGLNVSIHHNISYADISECESLIRSNNSIDDNENLIIGEIELKKKNEATNGISGYIIMNKQGTKYSLTPCSNSKTIIYSPIEVSNLLDFSLARKFFNETGIDMYDPNEAFFNDLCTPFTDENGNDVILKDRRDDFFKNSSLCEQGCEFKSINYETITATCECPIKENKFDEVFANSPIEFPGTINTNNLKVIKCYHNVFSSKGIKHNYGSWILIVLMCMDIPILINLFIIGYKPIYAFLNQFSQERLEEELRLKDKEKGLSESDDIEPSEESRPNPPQKSPNKAKEVHSNMLSEYDSPQPFFKLQKQKLKMLDMDLDQKNNDRHNSEGSNNESAPKCYYGNEKQITAIQDTNKHLNNEEENEFDSDELNEMAYEDALQYDKRCICKFYLICLRSNLSLINVFAEISALEPITIRLLGFTLNIAIFLVLNMILFDESYISKRYDYKDYTIGYIIENELPKSAYASMASVVVGFLINYVTSSKKRFETLMDKEKDHQTFLVKTREIITQMKKTTVIFIIINFVLMFFFWYYITAFCSVYNNSQDSWLIGTAITLMFCWLFQAFLAFLITFSRYMGLKCHISCLYTLSTYFC